MRQAFDGKVEIDESYFGGVRAGKLGYGASRAGKVAVFGLLKCGRQGYMQMIADGRRDALAPIIRRRIKPDRVVYDDTFPSHATRSAEGHHHVRIDHERHLTDSQGRHINSRSGSCCSSLLLIACISVLRVDHMVSCWLMLWLQSHRASRRLPIAFTLANHRYETVLQEGRRR